MKNLNIIVAFLISFMGGSFVLGQGLSRYLLFNEIGLDLGRTVTLSPDFPHFAYGFSLYRNYKHNRHLDFYSGLEFNINKHYIGDYDVSRYYSYEDVRYTLYVMSVPFYLRLQLPVFIELGIAPDVIGGLKSDGILTWAYNNPHPTNERVGVGFDNLRFINLAGLGNIGYVFDLGKHDLTLKCGFHANIFNSMVEARGSRPNTGNVLQKYQYLKFSCLFRINK